MEVGPGHPWYFQKPCHVDFKDKQVIEGGTQWLCSAPIATTGRCSSLRYIRFVVNVDGAEAANHWWEQCPDSKGPSLEAIHCARETSRSVEKGVSGFPPNSSSEAVRELSLQSPWLGKVQALMLHVGTRRNGKNSKRKLGSAPFQMPTVGWVNSKSRNLTNSPLWQLFLG